MTIKSQNAARTSQNPDEMVAFGYNECRIQAERTPREPEMDDVEASTMLHQTGGTTITSHAASSSTKSKSMELSDASRQGSSRKRKLEPPTEKKKRPPKKNSGGIYRLFHISLTPNAKTKLPVSLSFLRKYIFSRKLPNPIQLSLKYKRSDGEVSSQEIISELNYDGTKKKVYFPNNWPQFVNAKNLATDDVVTFIARRRYHNVLELVVHWWNRVDDTYDKVQLS